MTKEEKISYLDRGIREMNEMIALLLDIKGGMPESEACRAHGMNQARIRSLFYRADTGAMPHARKVEEGDEPWTLPTLCFEERLFAAVVPGTKLKDVPSDVVGTMRKAMKTLTARERQVLHMRLGECMTLEECGEVLGVTGQRVRQVEAKALRKMRHPSRIHYIKAGEGWYREQKRIRLEAEIEYEKRIIEANRADRRKLEHLRSERLRMIDKDLNGPDMDEVTGIEVLELSVRAYNCLARAGIDTIGKLKGMTREDLMRVRNLGRKSMEEVIARLFEETGVRIR